MSKSETMNTFGYLFTVVIVTYTSWCCLYGPPYNDAYGKIVHAAYCATAVNQMARCP